MLKRVLLIITLLIIMLAKINAQQSDSFEINYIPKNEITLPGQIVNFAFMVKNNSMETNELNFTITVPESWKVISKSQKITLDKNENKLALFTVQVSSSTPVGLYDLKMILTQPETGKALGEKGFSIKVDEVEKISLLFVKSDENVNAGETFYATYLLQNSGNTKKRIFIETQDCDVVGSAEIELEAGQSKQFEVSKQTSAELTNVIKKFYTVRAMVSGEVKESIFRSYMIYPTKESNQDFFFRYPVSVEATYFASNVQDKFESGYQFQVSGNGTLDTEGKHKLEFLARGPNLSDLSYLGLYDQYFVSYSNKNVELFLGDKAYSFTPLTESSRYGKGVEGKVIFNNGFSLGATYVKPRFYRNIESEVAGFVGFELNKDNKIGLHYIQKNDNLNETPVRLASVMANMSPLEKIHLEVEYSKGRLNSISDNAFRASVNTQFSIFYMAGIYFYTGKNYPGYYTNSTFYSGSVSARISQKLNLSFFAKEDFANAELDTFFVTAPYTKSFQSSLNYNISKQIHLKFFGMQFERKDRLDLDKFHYQTKSLNSEFSHKFRKIDYSFRGEFGETTNLLQAENNQRITYRGGLSFGYQLNSRNSIKLSGGWSNVNSFVSGDNRNLTAGLYIRSELGKNLRANLQLQNAYNIDDYYRNRNLMNFNIEYKFLKNHTISARSFYTLFKQQTVDPEFTATISYAYNFGIPLSKIIKAGEIKGQITYDNGQPVEGLLLNLMGKSVITNSEGQFHFNTVSPGKHVLIVDRSKMEINEIINIHQPIEVDVFEDQETVIILKITTGAKLTGKIEVEENRSGVFSDFDVNSGNIVVELSNEFDQFRVATDGDGSFSFPLVRPGSYTVKIYESSVPEGYELESSVHQIELKAGEERSMEITLKPKKRNIIFKSTQVLTPVIKSDDTKLVSTKSSKLEMQEPSIFYSIQIGAFRKKQNEKSSFFRKRKYDFEEKDGELYKYFIGKFENIEDAKAERAELAKEYKNPFIVIFENGAIMK